MEKPGVQSTGLQANDGLTGNKKTRAMGNPNHLRLCQDIATPYYTSPRPTRQVSRLLE